MSYVYLLPLQDKSAFKIGKTASPMRRITTLTRFYDVDFPKITIVKCGTTQSAYQLETILHSILEPYRVPMEYDGGTEFFELRVYGDTVKTLELICKMRGYSTVPFVVDTTVPIPTPSELITRRVAGIVRNKRLELNLTQSDLAKSASVSKRTIERFESNWTADFDNVVKILSALGLENEMLKVRTSTLSRKRARKRKLFVGDDDHDPEHKWEITVPA